MAVQWHNLLAHYNSYFLAREKMTDVELATWKSIVDNYNRPLAVLPPPGQAKASQTILEEIVKKGSIPIQRHKNSDWVDDSYLLIGKARYYQDDYENAVHTFRYLVYKAKDENIKHAAIVWLLRTYTDVKEYSYARQATEAALGKVLNKKNKKDFYLAMAHYHSKFREWPEVLGYVEEALPLMKRNFYRARMEFLAGQLRQRMGDDSLAHVHFAYVSKCLPTYELDFNAKVSAAQTLATTDEKGVKSVRKYFRKQLRDEKNLEYQDKVYYEMARFELRQNEPKKAIEYATSSLRSNGKTAGMKGYTYLLKGQIYYNKFKRFDLAKIFYDSAVAALDTADEQYKAVVKRQKILKEFVGHYEVVQHEDSVRALAALDSTALTAALTKLALNKVQKDAELSKAAEKEARRQEREEAAKEANQGTANPNAPPTASSLPDPTASGGEWYFYNPAQVARGKAAFARKWGRRILEDNWRRSKKEIEVAEDDPNTPATPKAKSDSTSGTKVSAAEKGKGEFDKKAKQKEPSEQEAVASLVETYRKGLPLTKADQDSSDRKLQPALFALGKIYDQKLEEPGNALTSFGRLTTQYPNYDKDAEAMYNLFIIYTRQKKTQKADSVKAALIAKHPGDLFAKLADDPEYRAKSRAQTEAAKVLYSQAYSSYKGGRYIEAGQALASIRAQYPENNFRDRIDLLAALLAAKSIDPVAYSDSLKGVAARYPKSELMPTIQKMQEMVDAYNKPKEAPAQPTDTTAGKQTATAATAPPAKGGTAQWSTKNQAPFLFIALLTTGSINEQEASHYLTEFNKLFYTSENLTTSTAPFNTELFIARAAELRSNILAKVYLEKQESLDGAFDFVDPRAEYFILTPENYRELLRTKDLEGFRKFYKENPLTK